MLGLPVGARVSAHLVPHAGVEHARKGNGRWDGRASAAELLARAHGHPHDLVLLAVPAGLGEGVLRHVAEALNRAS